ncbi:MAG TPA: glycosyl hydrolase-related protein [Deinococcales bacterium]|nr:glycosyl hydrolase-related protein [Deinococcales bacterium]
MSVTVFMVHHTHWDREWWGTFNVTRFRLVNVVDALLETLARDPGFSFTLDGQTIALDDYLEVRPERAEELLGYIRAGRVVVGPWRVLPDEFLVSPEATIRNLWLGERSARRHGFENARVGYLPDQFGHIAQMPQLLAGFGLTGAVVWRGFGAPPSGAPEGDGDIGDPTQFRDPRARNAARYPARVTSEFWWESPDGTRVPAVYLPLEYYRGHHKAVPGEEGFEKLVVDRARAFVDYMRPYATTNLILEPMGGDHLPHDPRLEGIIGGLNDALAGEGVRYERSTYAAFLDAVRGRWEAGDVLKEPVVWPGEGRAYGRKAHLLPGVLSARLYLKHENFLGQRELEAHAEPLQALNWLQGGAYEQNYLWLAWDKLVQNHPHDSICGCSHDQVHREMLTRFAESRQSAGLLAAAAAQDLAARVQPSPAWEGLEGQDVVVFNTGARPVSGPASVTMNAHWGISRDEWRLLDDRGAEVAFALEAVLDPLHQLAPWTRLGLTARPEVGEDVNAASRVSFVAEDVPALGYRSYRLARRERPLGLKRVRDYAVAGNVARDKGAQDGPVTVGPGLLENDFLRITVEPGGTLRLEDRRTGQVYPGLNAFVDDGENGDTYNHSWPLAQRAVSPHRAEPAQRFVLLSPTLATLRLTWDWPLPASLTPDREARSEAAATLRLNVDLTLAAGARRLDVRVHGENGARDHRLRARFPLGVPVESAVAESHGALIERPAAVPSGERGSAEPQPPEEPNSGLVSVLAGGRGLAVLNRGLPEYSVDPADGAVQLTLLRAVGWLSREDGLARAGGAGPTLATPDAQMIGPFEAEYSLVPHDGSDPDRLVDELAAYQHPLYAVPREEQAFPLRPHRPSLEATLPTSGPLVGLEAPAGVRLSALKRAEGRETLVVRLLNETGRNQTATLALPGLREAWRLNLLEERQEGLPVAEGSVAVELRPWAWVTVELATSRG